MAREKKKPKTGLVPSGYDYLGPGNDLNRGPPRNRNDAVAQDHDIEYGQLSEENRAPYRLYSGADERFLEGLEVDDVPTAVARGIFGAKKTLNRVGLLDNADSQPNLRGRANMARSGTLRGSTSFNEESRRRAIEHGKAAAAEARRARDERVNAGRVGLGEMVEGANRDAEDSLANLPGVPDDDDLNENTGTLLDDMEVPGNDGENVEVGNAMVSFAAGGGGPNGQSKETPVSIPPSITYGLQETHTTILPWNGWITAANLDYGLAVQLPIRMNGVTDMLPITTLTDPAAGSAFAAKGLYAAKATNNGGRSFVPYPASFASASTDPTERPSWREYWFQIYEYYTVLKCHYEIIVENPVTLSNAPYNGILIGTQFDSYSDTASSVGNVMPPTTLVESMAFKGLRWEKVDSQGSFEQQRTDNNRTVITGTWMPGMTKRNIVNDGDVKTWTATAGLVPPNLKELLTVNFWRHPFVNANSAASVLTCANIQINLKYVVQFKDLKLQARYPNTASAAGFNITQLLNNNAATGQAYQAPL